MPCTSPLDGWMSRKRTPLGRRRVVFTVRDSYHDLKVTVPCGKCASCQLERARQWAVRCVHEASLWPVNSFVTLTYRENPVFLRPRDFVLFMKLLREARRDPYGCDHGRIRFFQAGEFGAGGRPHHHALLFNCGFPDSKPHSRSPSGAPLYRSAELERLWEHGFSTIGAVTHESAAYVARYTLKRSADYLADVEVPEPDERGEYRGSGYVTMSRRPGIGAGWLQKWRGDVYPLDQVVSRGGREGRPPRFYDEQLKAADPRMFARLKRRRIDAVSKVDPQEFASGRLIAKDQVVRRRVKDFLKREL